MRVKKPLRATIMSLALLVPSTVSAQQFYCTVNAQHNIMPPEFLIDYSGGSATVTHNWIDAPSIRQVQVRGSGARANLSYTISDVSGFGAQRATLRFSLRHNRSNNQLRVTIDPVEYANTFTASGSCVPA